MPDIQPQPGLAEVIEMTRNLQPLQQVLQQLTKCLGVVFLCVQISLDTTPHHLANPSHCRRVALQIVDCRTLQPGTIHSRSAPATFTILCALFFHNQPLCYHDGAPHYST